MDTPVDDLARRAAVVAPPGIEVLRAEGRLDERLDGEPVVRLTLVLADPAAGHDTWDLDAVNELRNALNREALGREMPPVSMTLVAVSEESEVGES